MQPMQELPEAYVPSGGAAPPSPEEMADIARAYDNAAATAPQPRMMTLGTRQDPPASAAPPPPLPVPAATSPPEPTAAPTFAPPMFESPSFVPAPESAPATAASPDAAPADTTPPDAPAAPESTPPAISDPPMFTPPPTEPLSAQPLMSADPGTAATVPAPPGATGPPPTTALVPSANSNDPFDVVRVFYGTDRMPTLVNRDTFVMRLIRFTPAALLIILTGIGIGVVLVSRKPTWIIGTAALLVCSTLAVWHGISETLAISQLAAEEEPRYSAEKSDRGRIERGICEVSIPKTHSPGELEGPSITRLEFKFDPAEHVTLRKTVRLQNDAFYEQLQAQVASSPDRELLVFVHGFNVKFEDAARRTAQMAHDLKLQGAPVFFSWPADQYFLLTYGKDETNVSWSAPHLKEFLLDLVHNTDARSINLVAHSMGNRALTSALRDIDLQLRDEARLFNQVVLAAPDIDADDFRDNIAPAIQRTAKQVTLYASGNDIALGASRFFHRNARAGDTSRGLVLVPGMHTIDVSNIDGGPWGHSYYGASDPVLRDLHLLLTSLPPERRTWLNMKELDGQTYWAFKPLGTAGSPALTTPR
jgi:esterase/lipase superfamily enzyme